VLPANYRQVSPEMSSFTEAYPDSLVWRKHSPPFTLGDRN
jgi:hypothetical protein